MATNEELKAETAAKLLTAISSAAQKPSTPASIEQLAHAYSLVVRPGGAPRS